MADGRYVKIKKSISYRCNVHMTFLKF